MIPLGAPYHRDIKEILLDCQKELTWTTHFTALLAVLSHVVRSRRTFILWHPFWTALVDVFTFVSISWYKFSKFSKLLTRWRMPQNNWWLNNHSYPWSKETTESFSGISRHSIRGLPHQKFNENHLAITWWKKGVDLVDLLPFFKVYITFHGGGAHSNTSPTFRLFIDTPLKSN